MNGITVRCVKCYAKATVLAGRSFEFIGCTCSCSGKMYPDFIFRKGFVGYVKEDPVRIRNCPIYHEEDLRKVGPVTPMTIYSTPSGRNHWHDLYQQHQRDLNQQARGRVHAMSTIAKTGFFKRISTLLPRRREPMFKDAKPGDRVWSFIDGWGVISDMDNSNHTYPLTVQFDSGNLELFTGTGKHDVVAVNPTLYWDSFEISPPPKPKKKVKVKMWQYIYQLKGSGLFKLSLGHWCSQDEFMEANPSFIVLGLYEPSMIEVEE